MEAFFLPIPFLLILSFFDIFNKRNIPDFLVYAFFFSSVFFSFIEGYIQEGIIISIIITAIGYHFWKNGQIGDADVFAFISISMFKPFSNVLGANIPTALYVFFSSGVLLSIYLSTKFIKKIISKRKTPDNPIYLIILIPLTYTLAAINSIAPLNPLLSASAFLTTFSSVLFLSYREFLTKEIVKEKTFSELSNGDIIANYRETEGLPKVVFGENKHLFKNLKSIPVYEDLPPFIPFILLGYLSIYFI